jgi:hypothetical protein
VTHRSHIAVPEAFECEEAPAAPRFSLLPAHRVEEEVTRTLREAPGVHVQSLSVHRTKDGVCLHGVVEVDGPCTDLGSIIRQALSIDQVVNRMIIKQRL